MALPLTATLGEFTTSVGLPPLAWLNLAYCRISLKRFSIMSRATRAGWLVSITVRVTKVKCARRYSVGPITSNK